MPFRHILAPCALLLAVACTGDDPDPDPDPASTDTSTTDVTSTERSVVEDSAWDLAGEWPTYGFSGDQTRNARNLGATPALDPSVEWELTLPVSRHTMFVSSAVIGEDRLYVPFFGIWDYLPSGGVQAIDADGTPLWYFAARETEAQAPVVARGRDSGETVVLFGTAARPYGNPLFPEEDHFPALMAVYDREGCRCCVNRDEVVSACEFSCVDDSLCETYAPDSPYEWRHSAHVDPASGEATCEQLDETCAAWAVSSDEWDPARVPHSSLGYYENCITPVLSADGTTAYYFVCAVDIFTDLTNLVVAMDVESRTVKWLLTEDDPEGWDAAGCNNGHSQLGWLTTSALFSDGSLLLGTRNGCLARIVDHGSEGRTEGVYTSTHPSILGVALDPVAGDDEIYAATHGQNAFQPGDLFKTSRQRLIDGDPAIWTWEVGKDIDPAWLGDAPGLLGAPVVAEVSGEPFVYAVAGDWTTGEADWTAPERGWIVRAPTAGPDGSEIILPLQDGADWFPAYNVTMDGNDDLWVHGGRNRAVDGSGRILRIDADLTSVEAITATDRYGTSEVLLSGDALYAISPATWDGEDTVHPVVYKLR